MHSGILHGLAVGVRLILGAALLVYADESRFPLALEILGWLALAAALVPAITPHCRFGDLVLWITDRFSAHMQWGGAAAIPFGAFLAYAAG